MFPHAGLLLAKGLVVHMAQDHVQDRFVVAAVICDAARNVVTVLKLGNQVLPPQLHRVDAQLDRQQIDQPFHQESSLGTAGATVGVYRGRVIEHPVNIGPGRADVIRAAVHQSVEDGRDTGAGRGQVGAHTGVDHRTHARDLTLAGGGHLHMFDMVAAVNRPLEPLGSGGCPLYGAAQLHGAEGNDHLVGIHGNLTAETAADLGGDDPDLVLAYPGHQRSQEPADMGVLAGAP